MAIWASTGFESTDISTADAWWNSGAGGGGSFDYVTDIVKTGNRAAKVTVVSGNTRYALKNYGGATDTLVFSGQLYMDSLPTTNPREVLRFRYASATKIAALTVSSTGVMQARLGTTATPNTANSAAGAIATGQWYRIEMRAILGATNTMEWKIDGVDQTQPTGVAGASSWGQLSFGAADALASATYVFRWDDIAFDDVGANYPLGPRPHLPLGGTLGTYDADLRDMAWF